MLKRWAGPVATTVILLGVVLILLLNLDVSGPSRSTSPPLPRPGPQPAPANVKGQVHEYPIGDDAIQNHMRIAAVWLPAIQMAGMDGLASPDVIHLEADIHATEGNPNGFALGEFVPYLKVSYKIAPAGGGAALHHGEMIPMVAADGLHYGASISMPRAGKFRLTFDIQPPSGTLGRHSDPATGVAPWWEPFQVSFDWDYDGAPRIDQPTR